MKKQIKSAVLFCTTKPLAAVHFVTQSIADIAMETESVIRVRIDGTDRESNITHRVMTTLEKQQFFIDKYQSSAQAIRNLRKNKSVSEEVTVEYTVHEVESHSAIIIN